MLNTLRKWIDQLFADEEALLLLLLIAALLGLVLTMGSVLAPFIASLIIAFLLQGLISQLRRRGVPQWLAFSGAYTLFMGAYIAVLVLLLPLVWQQLTHFFDELPSMLAKIETNLMELPQHSKLVTEDQINQWLGAATGELSKLGHWLVSLSLASLPSLVNLMIYAVLVPILVFFLLKDRELLLNWAAGYLPRERPLMRRVWLEMNQQVANYVRGKAVEIVLVGAATYVAFIWLGLNFAALLALLVALSVVIPYIGAVVVTIPVALVGYIQWGWQPDFFYMMTVYLVIQTLDGNVLVPLLFSEAVNMHPVAIILAVLVFGGLWGFWGVFFAIPLATLIKAIISAWPTRPTPSL